MANAFSAGIRKLAKKCNSFFHEGSSRKDCIGFFIENTQVGFVRPDIVLKLKQFPNVFDIVEKTDAQGKSSRPLGIHLSQTLMKPEERTKAVNAVLEKLRDHNEVALLQGWYNEKYRIAKAFSDEPLMQIERSAAPLFGVVTYGTHINGYTYNDSGELLMWIATRAKGKTTYPGMFDNLCAGGLGDDLSTLECAKKECKEEASLDDQLLKHLKPVGTVSYCLEDERGVMPECEFVFDLELPQSFQPVNADGEVESFQLLPIAEVKQLIIQDNFKPNCAFIILDFLIRHGIINADSEPDYCFMVSQVHTPLHSIFSSGAL